MTEPARPSSSSSASSVGSHFLSSHRQGDALSAVPSRTRRMRFSRSKGGCHSCKKIKKKCDQGRPVCERCKTGDRECTYPSSSDTPERGRPTSIPRRDTVNQDEFDVTAYVNDTPAPTLSTAQAAASFIPTHDPLLQSLGIQGGFATVRDSPIANTGGNAWIPGDSMPQSANQLSTQLGTADESQGFDIDDTFLQAFLGASSYLSFESGSLPGDPPPIGTCPTSEPHSIVPTTVSQYTQPSDALHSVPIDCDSNLWSSFVDSTLWTTNESSDGENGQLMDYFKSIASTTVVVSNGAVSTSRFYTELANMATEKGYSALKHSVMCVSAQHLANWARKTKDMQKVVAYSELAVQHRSKALNLLRVASVDQSTKDEAIAPAVLLMLVLSANLKGEAEVVSSLLKRCSVLLRRIEGPSMYPFLPTISAIHSVYTGFHSIGSSQQLDLNGLFPQLDHGTVWTEQAKDACQQIYGISLSVFKLLLRCDSLIKQCDTIQQALDRAPNDEELLMMVMEITSEASGIRTDLSDRQLFAVKYNSGSSDCKRIEKLIFRHEFYRLACMLMIFRGVFKINRTSPRVQSLVTDMLSQTSLCTAGTEIGLLWPFIIVGSEAEDTSRESCLVFVNRCQWKGSGGPRHAEAILREVWRRRDKGLESGWREVTADMGSPLVI